MLIKGIKECTPITVILAAVFSVGLILGAVSLGYIPMEILSEVRGSFDIGLSENTNFYGMWKNNFIIEAGWIAAIWILGNMSITAPFSAAVIALRGYITGFSVAFVLTGENSGFTDVIMNVLPQCMIMLPSVTLFCAFCIYYCMEKDKRSREVGYVGIGLVWVGLTAILSAAESGIAMLFIQVL